MNKFREVTLIRKRRKTATLPAMELLTLAGSHALIAGPPSCQASRLPPSEDNPATARNQGREATAGAVVMHLKVIDLFRLEGLQTISSKNT